MLESVNLLHSLSGFVVGLLIGMTGVGGGSVMTPILILLFGINPAVAVGTDLLYASVTKTAGTMAHGIARTVEWKVVGRLGIGSVPATALTIAWLSGRGVENPDTGALITWVLSIALLVTSVALVFRSRILAFAFGHVAELTPAHTIAFTVATGAVLGILVSISSVGAGALGVTALILLYPRLPMLRIIGSDIAHAVPLTLAAGIGHWYLGSIDWALLSSLLIGSVPGIVAGSYAATKVPELVLRSTLAAILVVVAVRLLLA